MEFGLLLPSELPDPAAGARRVRELRELVRVAREVGFTSVWALHHHVSNVPTLQPVPLLASVATAAEGMTLGTGVFVLPLRNPVVVAEEFATLDAISGGRTVLGAAVGYYEPEFRALQVPLAGRGARMEHSIEVLRALWRGETLEEDGEYGHLDGVSLSLLPTRPGGPPVYLGGMSEVAIRRAARLGDGWLLPPDLDARKLASKIGSYREVMEEMGRTVTVLPAQRECLLATDGDEARRHAEPFLRQNAEVYAERGMTWMRDGFERWFTRSYLVGDPDEAGERVAQLAALGVTELHLRVGWGEVPFASMLRTIELAGRHLVPAFGPRADHDTAVR